MADVCQKHGVKLLTYGTLVGHDYSLLLDLAQRHYQFSVAVSYPINGWEPQSQTHTTEILRLPSERYAYSVMVDYVTGLRLDDST